MNAQCMGIRFNHRGPLSTVAALFLLALVFFGAVRATAQVIIIDHRRPEIPIARSYEIRELAITGTIEDQVAQIQIAHTLHNPGSFPLEAEFLFPVPDQGVVQSMTLMVDGKEIPGRLLPKDEARSVYEGIVRQRRDPALMEYVGSGLYRTSVFPIPPGADRQVTIRYTQLCRMEGSAVNFTALMDTQKLMDKPIENFKLRLRILSKTPIKTIYSPTHEPKIERSGDNEARISLDERMQWRPGDFRLLYSLDKDPLGVTVLSTRPNSSEDGFFLLLASPEIKKPDTKPLPKAVVLVLDHSGSMTGNKIEQAREALRFCLNNLKPEDTFNIVSFNDTVETYKPTMQTFDEKARGDAERFVKSIEAGGGTDINSALTEVFRLLGEKSDRPAYVLFMTDGQPTVGEQNEMKISDNMRKLNKAGARLFAFGVGYDVNARLLDRLSGGAGGSSEYVRPSENIEAHVGAFAAKLTSPVLSDIKIKLSRGELSQVMPQSIPDLFEGGQLILAGRYREPGAATLTVTGKVGGKEVGYEYPVKFADADQGASVNYVERLWAMRRIGTLIDQIDLNGRQQELVDELTRLSTKYGIMTPYTSFLADERTDLADQGAIGRRASVMFDSNLGDLSGPSGTAQRDYKQQMMKASVAPMTAPESAASRKPMGGRGGFGGGGGYYAYDPSDGTTSRGDILAQGQDMIQLKLKGETATEKEVGTRAEKVRQLGPKTFFLKEGAWVESDLKPEEVKAAVAMEQFSDAYFKLSREIKPEDNQYLTFSEPVVVKLAGKVYRINLPPAK